MAVSDIVPVPSAQFEETLASASPDVLREMIREFAQRTMDADVDVAWNAGWRSRSCAMGRTSQASWVGLSGWRWWSRA
jgi:hypothetical protein